MAETKSKINIGRVIAIGAAVIAALNMLSLMLMPLVEENPQATKVLVAITSVTALLSPFLPRVQGGASAA